MVTASGVASYAYDGLGRRVYASGLNPQPSRTTVYGQGGQLFFSNSQQNALTTSTRYVYLGGKLIAEDGTAGVVYNHTDALGSPVARSNASGQLLTITSYEPYGKTAAGTNPAMVGFTGHVNDGDTGLVQMQQRYYDPLAARFMSEDPVMTNAETGTSFNRYVYGNNNPYKYRDPDGRQATMSLCFGGPIACGVGITLTAATAYYGAKAVNQTQRALENAVKNESAEAPKESGSYTNTHESGKTYDGKGGRERSQQSGRRVEEELATGT